MRYRILVAAVLSLAFQSWAGTRQQTAASPQNSNGSVTANSAGVFPQKGKPTPTPTPTVNNVSSTIFDAATDLSNTPLLLQSDNLYASGAPGNAIYTASPITGVISVIDDFALQDWNLDLRSSLRGFYLTLNPVSGSVAAGLPAGPFFYNGRLISRCYDPTGATTNHYNWFNITGVNPNCGMRVNFSKDNLNVDKYFIVMSPVDPGTGRAEVHCNTVTGGRCQDWTILPNQNHPNIANLYSISARGGKETLLGAYYLTFRMHITYP